MGHGVSCHVGVVTPALLSFLLGSALCSEPGRVPGTQQPWVPCSQAPPEAAEGAGGAGNAGAASQGGHSSLLSVES